MGEKLTLLFEVFLKKVEEKCGAAGRLGPPRGEPASSPLVPDHEGRTCLTIKQSLFLSDSGYHKSVELKKEQELAMLLRFRVAAIKVLLREQGQNMTESEYDILFDEMNELTTIVEKLEKEG